jgi:hypothetical protein
MTKIYTPLVTAQLDNADIVSLYEPFGFNSDVIKKHKLKWHYRPPEPWNSMFPEKEGDVWFPRAFVYDFESVPRALRGPTGENKRGGTGHDGVCRKGVKGSDQAIEFVCPGMTKSIAADVYFEIMEYCDSVDKERFKKENHPWIPNPIIVPVVTFKEWLRREVKSNFVRFWPGDFFQKYDLDATGEEIAGIVCDPYVTMLNGSLIKEKVDIVIERTEVNAGMTGATSDMLDDN